MLTLTLRLTARLQLLSHFSCEESAMKNVRYVCLLPPSYTSPRFYFKSTLSLFSVHITVINVVGLIPSSKTGPGCQGRWPGHLYRLVRELSCNPVPPITLCSLGALKREPASIFRVLQLQTKYLQHVETPYEENLPAETANTEKNRLRVRRKFLCQHFSPWIQPCLKQCIP